ncbi:hypothetical protein J1C56_09660 [Aminobacter anthyllidis]|uniref:Uncharacterized protein n=1 Tax=Aminobacter anthyllidis TaxID=1035067 RepID=A0A9X1A9J2_9HYPH|nr:hypothetical protein [Aminobacter anthyllidis]MBT1155856.1 hypothetical protein [Aminobacter anthyllidis]
MLKVPNALFVVTVIAATSGASSIVDAQISASRERAPVGTYLWFPDSAGPKSEDECRALVASVKPSRKRVEQWLWGRMPNSDPGTDDFYLVLTETRMDPTFSAEGDYDAGEVALGPTMNGETPFTLVPDDHPDTTIKGTIVANPNSQIVAVTLRDIPLDDGQTDRTVYYCRFDEPMTET